MYKNDKKHGAGKLSFAGGVASYDGMYHEDHMDGYGVFRFDDGDVYEVRPEAGCTEVVAPAWNHVLPHCCWRDVGS